MIAFVGRATLWGVGEVGGLVDISYRLLFAVLRQVAEFRVRWKSCVLQIYLLGVESLPVIAFSLACFVLMLVWELSFHLKLVLQQDSLVPSFTMVFLVREVGPVVTGLLLCSRVGAGVAAELATMRATDQLDALRLLGVDVIEYLVVPRFVGTVVAAVTLTVISLAAAGLSAAFFGSMALGATTEQFFSSMLLYTRPQDLSGSLLKALVFGAIIATVSAREGLAAEAGSRGVGNAATNAVVRGSLLIIAADFVVTFLLYAF